MTQIEQAGNTDVSDIVPAEITLDDFKGYWIGLGAALDWIAMRGKAISFEEYDVRFDDGAEQFVRLLANLPDEDAARVVRGENVDGGGPLGPIPSGIWRITATSDSNDQGKRYRLIGTDDDDEWEGAILSAHHGGYRKVQVSCDFVLANWPPETALVMPTARVGVSEASLRRLIMTILNATPMNLAPLTQREVTKIVHLSIPNAPRDLIRTLCRELFLSEKPGPRGSRNPNRVQEIDELGERISAAQLPN